MAVNIVNIRNQWNFPMLLQPKVRRVDLDMFCKSESTGSVEAKYSKSRKTVVRFLYIMIRNL